MTKKPNYVFDDELYHHGILGQRWGHRRFQNEDGSWTPEGRERYGEGDARSKAKATYETQKYKLNLKSKAQKEKDRRAAKEERNRIKEAGKTARVIKKEQAKTDQEGRGKAKFRNTKKMSDEELQSAIDRLKLQSEYNKQYALAKKPDGALAKADRFFSGPTGEAVRAIAVAAVPNLMNQLGTLANTTLTNKLKYANKLDREKMEADIDKVRAEAEAKRNPVNNKGTKEHDQAVKDRAERMFGKNKDIAKESSNNLAGKNSGKTGITGQRWKVKTKESTPKASSTTASSVISEHKEKPLSSLSMEKKAEYGWTQQYLIDNSVTKVGLSDLNKKFIKKKTQYL
jgi:hypothetical protein